MRTFRIATRGSELALWQARFVAANIEANTEIVIITTQGDRDRTSLLSDIGGQGVFVKEVQAAVLEERCDIAVHSAKDLPTLEIDGLELAAYPRRGDPRDALVGRALEALQTGDTVATGSLRRKVQLMSMRPDLEYVPIRGNIASRLKATESYGSVVVAYAALERLNHLNKVAQVFEPSVLVPQVGQGALALECRSQDPQTRELLGLLDDESTRTCVESERSLLRELGSGCYLPVGAYATALGGKISLTGFIGSLDASRMIRVEGVGSDPVVLGSRLGKRLMAEGGAEILGELEPEI